MTVRMKIRVFEEEGESEGGVEACICVFMYVCVLITDFGLCL